MKRKRLAIAVLAIVLIAFFAAGPLAHYSLQQSSDRSVVSPPTWTVVPWNSPVSRDRCWPLQIETASGHAYEVRNRDFVAFSPKQTSLLLWFEENGEEHFALVPLLTVTAAVTKG